MDTVYVTAPCLTCGGNTPDREGKPCDDCRGHRKGAIALPRDLVFHVTNGGKLERQDLNGQVAFVLAT